MSRPIRDELGIEPGPELRRRHERILVGDTELLSLPPSQPPRVDSPSASARLPEAPRQLPADVRHFTGRACELKALSELLARDGTEAGAVVISAIGGMAGIGKTSLAIHWAHRHADRFPDGQLYADLRGFDPTGTPVSSAEAMRRFLVALGVPAQRIPADPEDQAALYRTRLVARRMLILLDNVRDAGQIRPLLPGSPGCVVLVTSRDRLAELVALNGAIPLTLDLLTEQEARDLLARRLGSERLAAEEHAVTALDLDQIRRALQALTRAHLLTEHAPGRHSFHDLLRAYATEQAHAHEAAAERRAALRRVCDFYLHTAHVAARLTDPRRASVPLDPPATGTRPHQPPDAPTAMAWFEVEHLNLLAAQQAAQAHHWYPTVWQLAWNLTTFHVRRGLRHDALAVWQAAAEAAVHLADPAPRVRAHRLLGAAHASLGRHQEAVGHLEHALALAEQLPDLAERAHTHRMLARAWQQRGDDQQALDHATRALGLFRALRQPEWEADALNNVGWFAACLGQYDTARTHCQAALELQRRHGTLAGEPATLDSLGFIEHHTGHHQLAIDHYQQALTLYRGSGNAFETASTLENLGHPHAALGYHEQARGVWRQALEMYRQQGRAEDAERLQRQLGTLD